MSRQDYLFFRRGTRSTLKLFDNGWSRDIARNMHIGINQGGAADVEKCRACTELNGDKPVGYMHRVIFQIVVLHKYRP